MRKLEQEVRHTASMSSLTRLARALNVDVPQLLGQAGTIEPMQDDPGEILGAISHSCHAPDPETGSHQDG